MMTPEEKTLYHQIHPLKLFTDISSEGISLYFFWRRKPVAGLITLLVPPIIASSLIMRKVDLEPYKRSSFGRYIQRNMTSTAVGVRVFGTIITHLGAWLRKPLLLPLGLLIVLLGWSGGLLQLIRPENAKITLPDAGNIATGNVKNK